MSNRTEEELREFKEDMRQEFLEDARHEQLMYSDEDYAIDQYLVEIQEAEGILRKVSDKLSRYGHSISTKELLDLI
jgi:hypothetical protein